jgi:hypothetical protein
MMIWYKNAAIYLEYLFVTGTTLFMVPEILYKNVENLPPFFVTWFLAPCFTPIFHAKNKILNKGTI